MRTSDFDYELPPEYIAQHPATPRDAARLMVLDRGMDRIEHTKFRNLGAYLSPGDLLVLNETRVIPARLFAHKIATGGRVEILLLKKKDEKVWETLVGGKGLKPGVRLQVKSGPQAEIVDDLGGPHRLVRFSRPVEPYLEHAGHVPLPPYIQTSLEDPERYQTVYARQEGSAAAPTAGLHFTPRLLADLSRVGIAFTTLTLHVGLDTFAPVNEANPRDHRIHSEWCQVPEEAAQAINRTRQEGGRIIAVGTTSVRTLESAAHTSPPGSAVAPIEGPTELFILPGYQFHVVDAMITNFHLPRSTLIMLVSAFAGRERILSAYQQAKLNNYRFYSFGDAMLIL